MSSPFRIQLVVAVLLVLPILNQMDRIVDNQGMMVINI